MTYRHSKFKTCQNYTKLRTSRDYNNSFNIQLTEFNLWITLYKSVFNTSDFKLYHNDNKTVINKALQWSINTLIRTKVCDAWIVFAAFNLQFDMSIRFRLIIKQMQHLITGITILHIATGLRNCMYVQFPLQIIIMIIISWNAFAEDSFECFYIEYITVIAILLHSVSDRFFPYENLFHIQMQITLANQLIICHEQAPVLKQ